MVNLNDWRPDPDQPALDPVPKTLTAYEGVTSDRVGAY